MKLNKTYIIAEIGPNHNGSLKLAIKYIKLLAKSGANAIKFQHTVPEKSLSKESFPAEYEKNSKGFKKKLDIFKRVEKRQLSKKNHEKLFKVCKKYKIDYLCSAFDKESLKFLNEKLKVKYFKIPSGEILSLDMLDYINKQKKKVILSTGMASLKEIAFCLSKLKRVRNKIILLHCVSNYPTRNQDVNLLAMNELKSKFKCQIGFSDHTLNELASLVAVSLGATVIEKHVTINKNLQGPDHKMSMNIKEFKEMVSKIREVENILGDGKKKISKMEQEVAKVARKSVVSKIDLYPGMRVTKKNICFKRPGTGILPTDLDKIIDKKLKKFLGKDRIILKKHLRN